MRVSRFTPLMIVALIVLSASLSRAGVTTVKIKFDTTAAMIMGSTKALNVEIVQDRGLNGYLLAPEETDTAWAKIEVAEMGRADTIDLGNNRVQINQIVTLQAFDPGAYLLSPLRYVVGSDTTESNNLALDVRAVEVDTTQGIFPFKPPVEVPSKLADRLPDNVARYPWLYLALIILTVLTLVGIWLYRRWRRNGTLLPAKKKLLPPYDEARQALDHLRSRSLWQHNRVKEYYSELTDILRRYVERRFDINAVEMTSSEIADAIALVPEAQPAQTILNDVMTNADLVKFAKVEPFPHENEHAFTQAEQFVELTKPVEKPQDDKKQDDDKDGKADVKDETNGKEDKA